MPWDNSYHITCSVSALFYTPLTGKLETHSTDKLSCDFGGAIGDMHSKLHTLSTVREEAVVDKGSYVLNHRQLALTSVEECSQVAAALSIPSVLPEDLMSNIHLSDISRLSTVFPGSFINFYDNRNKRRQLVLLVTAVNDPCDIPKNRIEARLGEGSAKGFEKAAYNKRGLVAMVFRPGFVKVDDTAIITIPKIYEP